MKQASRALVCKRRDGRHSCCAAVLIKTCSPHNVSTPVPNTTRSLSHNVHACKEAAAAANKEKKQLPINLKYDTCIVKSTNREEETEKIPFSGRRKTEGRVGYSDIEKAETEAARRNTREYRVRRSSPIVPRNSKANITLDSSFLGHLSNGSVH